MSAFGTWLTIRPCPRLSAGARCSHHAERRVLFI